MHKRAREQAEVQGMNAGQWGRHALRLRGRWCISLTSSRWFPGERLYQQAMVRVYEGPDTARVEDQQAQKCTFTPHVNERSRLIVERSRDLPSGFLERQVRGATVLGMTGMV